MAAKKNPKADEAYKLYKDGMKLVEIADRLEVPDGTVRRWKSTYSWDAERSDKKSERSEKKRAKKKAVIDDGTKETMQNGELTDKERIFCLYYIKSFNATQSYLKAYGCSYEVAHAKGPYLLTKVSVKKEIERLKEIKRQQIQCNESDIVELQMRIAFSDIGDALSFSDDGIRLKDSDHVDTQMIKEIKEGKSGISVKMKDQQKALDWLTMYFEMNPESRHKKEYDKRRLELEYLKLEAATKTDEESTEEPEDNFLEMLNSIAKDVWSDEQLE